mgnify:CR=1 FL=1
MTPQEKAAQLVVDNQLKVRSLDYKEAVQCAIVTVDEIIRTLNEDIRDLDVRGNVLLDLIEYWIKVKQELKNL